jgi:hypothetical protein
MIRVTKKANSLAKVIDCSTRTEESIISSVFTTNRRGCEAYRVTCGTNCGTVRNAGRTTMLIYPQRCYNGQWSSLFQIKTRERVASDSRERRERERQKEKTSRSPSSSVYIALYLLNVGPHRTYVYMYTCTKNKSVPDLLGQALPSAATA